MRFRQFFIGRYGADNLSRFISIITLVLLILGLFTTSVFLYLGVILLIYNYYRVLSRNISKRSAENYKYLMIKRRFVGWFSRRKLHIIQRKTHRFYCCPECKKKLRVPKGKGKISITCPDCRTQFIKKT